MTNLYKIALCKLVCVSILILGSKIVPTNPGELDDLSTPVLPSNGKSSGATASASELPKDSENFRMGLYQITR